MPPRGPIGDFSNDDYVAQVLANEARDNTEKYTSEGLGAYIPKRPSSAAPKPNTRFLRHIIRETDNHNAALKRKEEREARERMRQLRAQAGSPTAHDARGHSHRAPDERDRERERGREKRDDRKRKHRSHRKRERSYSASPDRERSRRHRRQHEDEYERHQYSRREGSRRGHDKDDGKRYSRRDRSYSYSRSRSPRDERDHYSRRIRRHRRSSYHSRSQSRSRSPEPKCRSRVDSHRSSRKHRELSSPPTDLPQPADDSDPLEDLVGPLPQKDIEKAPIRSRGRGAYKPNTSTIDSHFATDYDPTLDVHLDDDNDDDPQSNNKLTRRPVAGLMTDGDDWELALEALRDRARWKQKGEERLRQAGFDESTVERWKGNSAFTGTAPGRGGDDDDIEDVKWSKRGEGREWDRGKVFDEDGHVNVRADW